jgi:hypothetical protein
MMASDNFTYAAPTLHPGTCGPCEDCQEFLEAEHARLHPRRDPLVSYGIPPALRKSWRTGLPLFETPGSVKPDGTIVQLDELPSPSLDELVRHAERNGPDDILETAEELGYSAADRARLKLRLNTIEIERKRGFKTPRRRRSSSDETEAVVLAYVAEGRIKCEIAKLTGLREQSVQRYLDRAEAG